MLDNKYLYDKAKSMRELEAADDDHPLKLDNSEKLQNSDQLNNSPEVQEITKDLESVAVDWKTLRNITECSCSTPFDHFSRKVCNYLLFKFKKYLVQSKVLYTKL